MEKEYENVIESLEEIQYEISGELLNITHQTHFLTIFCC